MNYALQKSMDIATAPAVEPETQGALTIVDSTPVEIAQLERQIAAIQGLLKRVLKKGVHYGTIPGCGDKFALLKPGAEKICMLFRLIPDCEERISELGNGHREYRFITRLRDPLGRLMGFGVGSCSTMEKKYRYRSGDPILTDKPIPSSYWKLKDSDPKAAKLLLGGYNFTHKKNEEGKWVIAEIPRDSVKENPDIADTYNTVYKMAKKRSLVDATITATGASDIFEQRDDDDEDTIDVTEESKSAATSSAIPSSGRSFTYNLKSLDPKKQENQRIFLLKQSCREVEPNVWVCPNRIASLDSHLVGSVEVEEDTNAES